MSVPDTRLQTTALVNEVFLRLVDIHQVEWHDRVHFLTMAAQLMGRILVEKIGTGGFPIVAPLCHNRSIRRS
jgi:hypothetical protein